MWEKCRIIKITRLTGATASVNAFSGKNGVDYYGGDLTGSVTKVTAHMWSEPESSTEPVADVKVDGYAKTYSLKSYSIYDEGTGYCSDTASTSSGDLFTHASSGFYLYNSYVQGRFLPLG